MLRLSASHAEPVCLSGSGWLYESAGHSQTNMSKNARDFTMILLTAVCIGINQLWTNWFTTLLMIAAILTTITVIVRKRQQ
ncbi:hypothetical protein DUZ99_04655 [Xylanibacillus composti]|uniref:Uncharacterized protein n=1 Tax=Xylanibacillus composti TaxID=1572762 RepID=A0A8J4M233_9BACL|nr:hypothetical protein [Xylanibacillus composti]MDT9724279.1 hypothetical protein [Xylanibacillus composti]GIQ69274.1 hypothetical protein XYCOK13_20980 [Xylanibacillus composti]